MRARLPTWFQDQLRVLTWIDRAGIALLALLATVAFIWLLVRFFESAPPRRITLASGPTDGLYHQHAQRFVAALARSGVTVHERITEGSAENVGLLRSPGGVDIAFVQGGLATPDAQMQMLVTLFYEPLWIFMRKGESVNQLNRLAGQIVAVGRLGSGTAAVAPKILTANGVTADNTTFQPLNLDDGVRALKLKQVNAVLAVGAADAPVVASALRDPSLELVSLVRADAYARRFPHVFRLTLPAGAIDLASDHPPADAQLIATKAMLVARADLHPGVIDLLIDAAREIHTGQGVFERAGEFPGIEPVDLPVSAEAARYFREGATFLHRYFPFWVATFVERLIVFGVPIALVVAPLVRWLPKFIDWRFTQRVARWYGDLARLEMDIQEHRGAPEPGKWLAELERIRRGAERTHIPPKHASKAYAMRSHVLMVQRVIQAEIAAMSTKRGPEALSTDDHSASASA